MDAIRSPSIPDMLLVHVIFAASCVIVLMIPGLAIGAKMFALVSIYNVMIPLVGYVRNHQEWLAMWFFSFLVSVLMIWPDWFLSAQLDVLVFPEDGFLMMGSVSGYMAGLWAIPLFVLLFVGLEVNKKWSLRETLLVLAILSLIIFGLAEATMWILPSWYAQNVLMIGSVAVYIILPEMLLGLSLFVSYVIVRHRPVWLRIVGAFTVMILYMGNASFFYFLIEHVLPAMF